jgi:hypothetical protein
MIFAAHLIAQGEMKMFLRSLPKHWVLPSLFNLPQTRLCLPHLQPGQIWLARRNRGRRSPSHTLCNSAQPYQSGLSCYGWLASRRMNRNTLGVSRTWAAAAAAAPTGRYGAPNSSLTGIRRIIPCRSSVECEEICSGAEESGELARLFLFSTATIPQMETQLSRVPEGFR